MRRDPRLYLLDPSERSPTCRPATTRRSALPPAQRLRRRSRAGRSNQWSVGRSPSRRSSACRTTQHGRRLAHLPSVAMRRSALPPARRLRRRSRGGRSKQWSVGRSSSRRREHCRTTQHGRRLAHLPSVAMRRSALPPARRLRRRSRGGRSKQWSVGRSPIAARERCPPHERLERTPMTIWPRPPEIGTDHMVTPAKRARSWRARVGFARARSGARRAVIRRTTSQSRCMKPKAECLTAS